MIPIPDEISFAGTSVPHSREAEEAVLGSVLINPYVLDDLELLQEDFYIDRLGWVWETYQRLRKAGSPIDILTVSKDMDRQGKLDEFGGAAELTALLNQVPSALNAAAYADIVKAASLRRKLLKAANEMARLAYDESLEASQVVSEAESLVRAVANQAGSDNDIEDMVDVAGRLYDEVSERTHRVKLGKRVESRRIATGLTDLDVLLKGGMRRGALIVTAGRPGQGKSSKLLTIGANAAEAGKKVAFFGLEMPNEETTARYLSAKTGIDANLITEGTLAEGDWAPLTNAIEILGRGKIFLYGRSSLTPLTLRAKCARLKSRYGLDLVILDYMQLMRAGIKTQNREQEVAHISRELKILAGDLYVPILAAAQLNRSVENRAEKEPQLSDLRESGAIENDADVVMFIYRPDPENDVSRVKVAKQRGGPVGPVDLYFNKELTRFENLR